MIVDVAVQFIINVLSAMNYIGIFILTAMESMVLPMPTEVLMPLVGFLVTTGRFELAQAAVIAALGALFGSLISYVIGQKLGRKFILRYGKYLLLDKGHLQWTEKWFKEKGEKTVFISRFIPVVKHFISIPAGIGNMSIFRFSLYTVAGAGIWNLLLIYAGMWLGERWEIIHAYSIYLDIIALLVIVSAVVWFYARNHKK
jgi:membrane protein DedA with SNARE-associated domain